MYFEKWEALGNDFVLVFDPENGPPTPAGVRALCDRHRGVGADGVFVVTTVGVPTMAVWNADGSVSSMCGNGIRCVVGALAERGLVAPGGEVTLETGAGPRSCAVKREAEGWRVRVRMGTPSMDPALAGFVDPVDPLRGVPMPPGRGHVVSIGNPHWVFIEPEASASLAEWGPRLEHDPRFLHRTNVEFVTPQPDGGWTVQVWERGVGLTQACGSGAVSVASVLVALGRAPGGEALRMHLPGGPLLCTVEPGGGVQMEGPARRVFRGVWTPG
jgi:diaminopimelate epimerase